MLNDQLPILEANNKFPPSIKIGDGDKFEGIITGGEKINTQYGECFKFSFEEPMLNDKKIEAKTYITKSEFLAGKLNQATQGWTVVIERTGVAKNTRWNIKFIKP